MKLAMIVCNSYFVDRVMALLKEHDIDYYTRWDGATGKGHGTEPHLGSGAFGSTNSVLMIAFEGEAPLQALTSGIEAANKETRRPSDRIRVFQLPLERIV